jgi:hypothetical protein
LTRRLISSRFSAMIRNQAKFAMPQQPVVVGLIVCKDVIIDEPTRHVTPVNCVHQLRVRGTPTHPEDYSVCCILTDGDGEITFTLHVTDLSAEEDINTRSWRMLLTKSLDENWLLVKLREFVFPNPGRFEFLLLANGQWLARNTITILDEGDET